MTVGIQLIQQQRIIWAQAGLASPLSP